MVIRKRDRKALWTLTASHAADNAEGGSKLQRLLSMLIVCY